MIFRAPALSIMNAETVGITESDFDSDSSIEVLETINENAGVELALEKNLHAEFDLTSINAKQAPFKVRKELLGEYIYPMNLEKRDYQQNIVQRALKENVLCALPTGLGKTFIASTVMLNFYRWTVDAKVIFMAPTRPLVSQQIEACLGITGLPRHESTVMIGSSWSAAQRQVEWASKRVVFATPQIVDNDLKKGLVRAEEICCVVVDEAHRATGNYAYVEAIRQIYNSNPFVRILALTATPSGTLEGVQDIINNLFINRCEIRTEESLDTRMYVHKREMNKIKIEETDELKEITNLYSAAISPYVKELNAKGGLFITDPEKVTLFGIVSASKKYSQSAAARSKAPVTFRVRAIYTLMMKLAQAMTLLRVHGITQFYERANSIRSEGQKKAGGPGKILGQLLNDYNWQKCLSLCEKVMAQPNFLGHGKLRETVDIINGFFAERSSQEVEGDTRAIIFVDYRESAVEVLRVVEQQCAAYARAHLFVGQQSSSGGRIEGMKQKEQQKVVDDFRSGKYNILVCTSIGEEGLDIGQVDLIILYDQSRSPIRNIQRIGRTGRKRQGTIYMLMTEGEEEKSKYAIKGHQYIQDKINKGIYFDYVKHDPNCQIIRDTPKPRYEEISIPDENSAILESADCVDTLAAVSKSQQKKGNNRKRGPFQTIKTVNKKQKQFTLPDNVELGIVSATSLMRENIDPGKSTDKY